MLGLRLDAMCFSGCFGSGLGQKPGEVKVTPFLFTWFFVILLCTVHLSKMSSAGRALSEA